VELYSTKFPEKKTKIKKDCYCTPSKVKVFLRMYATRCFCWVFFLFGCSPFYTTWRSPLSAGWEHALLLHLQDTTQRGGGCVVAQGDVLPICLVGGVREGNRNAKKSEKLERGTCVRERLGVTALSLSCSSTRFFCFCFYVDIEISPSPPLPLGYIVVWRRAKKHLYGQSALSGSIIIRTSLTIQGWAEALLHLHLLLFGARIARTVDLVHLRYSNPALVLYLPDY
jgi:hypothetical protein